MIASARPLPERISLLRPTAVNAILAEVRELQAKGKNLVSLMRGEPDFKTPPHIVEACTRALANGRTTYPDNRGEKILREAVAEKLKRDNGLTYDPGGEGTLRISFGSGGDALTNGLDRLAQGLTMIQESRS